MTATVYSNCICDQDHYLALCIVQTVVCTLFEWVESCWSIISEGQFSDIPQIATLKVLGSIKNQCTASVSIASRFTIENTSS